MALQVQALIQGRASAWQQNLVLTPTKAGAGEAVTPPPSHVTMGPFLPDRTFSWRKAFPAQVAAGRSRHASRLIVGEHMMFGRDGLLWLCMLTGACAKQGGATEAAEAARIFEGQLAGALVAEDGQLALSNLAASAAHGFMPKIQTQGQLGQARWRLVSAPSIPGVDPLLPLLFAGDGHTMPSQIRAVDGVPGVQHQSAPWQPLQTCFFPFLLLLGCASDGSVKSSTLQIRRLSLTPRDHVMVQPAFVHQRCALAACMA